MSSPFDDDDAWVFAAFGARLALERAASWFDDAEVYEHLGEIDERLHDAGPALLTLSELDYARVVDGELRTRVEPYVRALEPAQVLDARERSRPIRIGSSIVGERTQRGAATSLVGRLGAGHRGRLGGPGSGHGRRRPGGR